jgi:hypothetical protein
MRLGVMVVAGLAVLVAAAGAAAQPVGGNVVFPPNRVLPSTNFPGATTGAPPPGVTGSIPGFNFPSAATPSTAGIGTTPPNAFGPPPAFDPYSANGPAAIQFWSNQTPPPALPNSVLPPNPAAAPYGSQWAAPVAGQPQPQTLFPNGIGWGDPNGAYPYEALRLIHDLRFRDTYLGGSNNARSLAINDAETSVTFAFPNFLTSGQPLFITPAFAVHTWEGPKNGLDNLPGSAYSAYLDLQHSTDPNLQIGAELGGRVGVYSEFSSAPNADSIRWQGVALGLVRLTPTMTLKAGAIYIDRVDKKILPAGGILWQPNPQLRVDLIFPQPRISQYVTTIGTYELWWYAAGEYGGGSWTVTPSPNRPFQQIDINDVRVSGGLEWTSPRGINGFIEAGYVFKRYIVYTLPVYREFDLNNTWMVRAGVSF